MLGKIIEKPLTDYSDYYNTAKWCNENGYIITDQGDYYEVCAPPRYNKTVSDEKAELTVKLNTIKKAYVGAALLRKDTSELEAEYAKVVEQLSSLSCLNKNNN